MGLEITGTTTDTTVSAPLLTDAATNDKNVVAANFFMMGLSSGLAVDSLLLGILNPPILVLVPVGLGFTYLFGNEASAGLEKLPETERNKDGYSLIAVGGLVFGVCGGMVGLGGLGVVALGTIGASLFVLMGYHDIYKK